MLCFYFHRYGVIQSVTPTRDIKAGEELFTYYGYKGSEFPADFLWYHEAEKLLEREERLAKEAEAKAAKKKSKKAKKQKLEKSKK